MHPLRKKGYTGHVHDQGLPTVLLPYPGPNDGSSNVKDIFLYLRPETNGMQAESTLFRVLKSCEDYARHLKLVYMANIPGEYISSHRIVERHYSLKLYYAVHGRAAFTPHMIRAFEAHFGVRWDQAWVMGAFEALQRLDFRPEELFGTWVPEFLVQQIHGQTIKRIGDAFVVNYDIPAILHKNTTGTDIAVMLFRGDIDYDSFYDIVPQLREALLDAGVLSPYDHITRAFHFSKGPLEELLDGLGYLYGADLKPIPIDQVSFGSFLQHRGVDLHGVMGLLSSPIATVRFGERDREVNVLHATGRLSYEDAHVVLESIVSQPVFHPAIADGVVLQHDLHRTGGTSIHPHPPTG